MNKNDRSLNTKLITKIKSISMGIYLTLFAMLFLCSCETKRLGEEIFDLNDFSFGLSVNHFYEHALKAKNTENYYAWTDTIFTQQGADKKDFAVSYTLSVNKPMQPLAKLKNINFDKIESLANAKDRLMMISATADCSFGTQMQLISQLKAAYGMPIVKQHKPSFTTFTWRLADRTVQAQCEVIPDYDNDRNKRNYFLNPNGGFLKSDSYEPNHIWKIFVYIFDNDNIERLINMSDRSYSYGSQKPEFNDASEKTVSPY